MKRASFAILMKVEPERY